MSDRIKELERILGGELEKKHAGVIPGVEKASTREVIYFSDDGKNKFKKQFKKITCFTEQPNATCGGINEAGCNITPPDGPLFHAVVYHGDLVGWKKDIEEGANGLNLLLAKVEGKYFIISDGRVFLLSECKVEFT